jgi:hypothetical protein
VDALNTSMPKQDENGNNQLIFRQQWLSQWQQSPTLMPKKKWWQYSDFIQRKKAEPSYDNNHPYKCVTISSKYVPSSRRQPTVWSTCKTNLLEEWLMAQLDDTSGIAVMPMAAQKGWCCLCWHAQDQQHLTEDQQHLTAVLC